MLQIRDLMAASSTSIRAAGTSEGAEKGWDTRGRGKSSFADQSAILKSHGWKAEGRSQGYGGTENYTHSGLHGHVISVNVDKDYDWTHDAKAPKGDKSPEAQMGGGWHHLGAGTKVESLADHLEKFHGELKELKR